MNASIRFSTHKRPQPSISGSLAVSLPLLCLRNVPKAQRFQIIADVIFVFVLSPSGLVGLFGTLVAFHLIWYRSCCSRLPGACVSTALYKFLKSATPQGSTIKLTQSRGQRKVDYVVIDLRNNYILPHKKGDAALIVALIVALYGADKAE